MKETKLTLMVKDRIAKSDFSALENLMINLSLGKTKLKDGTPVIWTYPDIKDLYCNRCGLSHDDWLMIEEGADIKMQGK